MRRFPPRLFLSILILAGLFSFGTAFAQEGEGDGGGGNEPPPRLSIVTRVVNDNGGVKGPADFTSVVASGTQQISVTGAGALGASVVLNIGYYAVTPVQDPAYVSWTFGACAGDLGPGETAVCTITYDDLGLTSTPPPAPCTEDIWHCTDWGACSKGTQTRECVMSFNCPNAVTPRPPTTQACGRMPSSTPPGSAQPPAASAPTPGTGSASDTGATGSASEAPVVSEPATSTPFASSGSCPWFWGWLVCYWWILLIIAVAVWRIRRSLAQSRKETAQA